jgi:hypothetical protein
MVGRLRRSQDRFGSTPRCGPSSISRSPRDPSRSCLDLQSIEPSSVAARLASRLRLRPWLEAGPWRIPFDGCPDRLTGRQCSSHGLAPSLRDRQPASARSAVRSTRTGRLTSVLPWGSSPLQRSHPGESTSRNQIRWAVRAVEPRPSDLPPEGDSLAAGSPVDPHHRPLPDSRRVGCRRGRIRQVGRRPFARERSSSCGPMDDVRPSTRIDESLPYRRTPAL